MVSENKDQDYSISILIEKAPHEVYEAIKDVKSWWIGEINGDANQVGSEFTYRYKEFHQSTQKVTELITDQKISWLVTKAFISFTANKQEWENTKILFEIIPRGKQTEIKFTHHGLHPQIECFKACSGGWDFYINRSLKSFLTTGKGLDPGF